MARHPRATRQTFAHNLEPSLELFAELLSKSGGKKADRSEAAAFLGLLAGTLQLARATQSAPNPTPFCKPVFELRCGWRAGNDRALGH